MAFCQRTFCFVCNVEATPRSMDFLNGEEKEHKREIAIRFRENLRRPAAQFIDTSRICFSCLTIITREEELENDPACTKLKMLHYFANNSCFVCQRNRNLTKLSKKARVDIFLQTDIFVTSYVRSCPEHLDDNGLLPRVLYPGLH